MKVSFVTHEPPSGKERDLPPVVLLHGRLDSKKTWNKLGPAIAQSTGRKVYAYDARNHGESPWSEEITFEVLADDLEELLDQMDIPRVVLLGHSLGGRTAITLALRKPERVEKLLVEDMQTCPYGSHAKLSVQAILQILREALASLPPGSDEAAARRHIVRFVQDNLPSTKEVKVFEEETVPIKKEGSRFSWQANLPVLERMLMSEETDKTPSGLYPGEALFLYGTESFFQVDTDETIYEYFPGAKKVAVVGAGHLIHHNFPDEFLEHVTRFINGEDSE